MKKHLFAAAVLALGFAAPAFAGNYCDSQGGCTGPSANDMHRADRYGYNYGPTFGGNYGYGMPLISSGSGGTCVLFVCVSQSHKPKNGELRQLADGTTISYDKPTNRWLVVNRPSTQPRAVYSDRDTYFAQ